MRELRSQHEIICAEASRFTLAQASLDKFRVVGLLVRANPVFVGIRYGVHDDGFALYQLGAPRLPWEVSLSGTF